MSEPFNDSQTSKPQNENQHCIIKVSCPSQVWLTARFAACPATAAELELGPRGEAPWVTPCMFHLFAPKLFFSFPYEEDTPQSLLYIFIYNYIKYVDLFFSHWEKSTRAIGLSTLIKISISIRLQCLKWFSTLFRVFSFQEIHRNLTLPEFNTLAVRHLHFQRTCLCILVWEKTYCKRM